MATLQMMMWETVVDPYGLWVIRNDNLYQRNNGFNSVDEEENMVEQLVWYVQNKHTILSSHIRILAQIDVTLIHQMLRAHKQE